MIYEACSDHLHPKGNHSSKFQLIRLSRFGGIREQKNKQTNTQTHSLTSYCFYRVISNFIRYKCTCNKIIIKEIIVILSGHNVIFAWKKLHLNIWFTCDDNKISCVDNEISSLIVVIPYLAELFFYLIKKNIKQPLIWNLRSQSFIYTIISKRRSRKVNFCNWPSHLGSNWFVRLSELFIAT